MEKDFISAGDLSRKEILEIFTLATQLKKTPWTRSLERRVIALLFEKPSTRTRVSFEAGVSQLGGVPIYMDFTTTQLARGESVSDTGRTLERYVDAIIARVQRHEFLIDLASSTEVPVINALSDREHPCQALADYYTIEEKIGRLEGVILTFIGDANNVFNSLAIMGNLLKVEVRIAAPKGYGPDGRIVNIIRDLGGQLEYFEDPKEAVRGADVIYTDVFVSMGQEEERGGRRRAFLPKYRVTEELMAATGKESLFMHCLPAHRGEEVTDAVIDSRSSIVFDQAENRLHTQKALLVKLVEGGFL